MRVGAWGEGQAGQGAFLISPEKITPDSIVRLLFASEEDISGCSLSVAAPSGTQDVLDIKKGGGPPFWLAAEFYVNEAGTYHFSLLSEKSLIARHSLEAWAEQRGEQAPADMRTKRTSWDRNYENLYAAWVEHLFQEAEEGTLWASLQELTGDSQRNILFNHLGLGEDGGEGEPSLKLKPDCADFPYFLRAYFAWKVGLPFAFLNHNISSGSRGSGRRIPPLVTNLSLLLGERKNPGPFQSFLDLVGNTVYSGAVRKSSRDGLSDFYPLPLNRKALSPGTIYSDPYGHVLVVARWVKQQEGKSGMLLAADAQPDGTIGLKRFWQGSFFFAEKAGLTEPGFKAFRPAVYDQGEIVILSNARIGAVSSYRPYSLEQSQLSKEEFYDVMNRLISPVPVDPLTAFRELHEAVHERLLSRVAAVRNGEAYMKESGDRVIPMPEGRRIFQTQGPWEDYSTPQRDLRLLIALDVLLDFPNKVLSRPEDYLLPEGVSPDLMKSRLEDFHRQWAGELTFTYIRSGGMEKTLTLYDVITRMEALETAYNPNDCIEIRWGERDLVSCGRRAPDEQRNRMEAYRPWFRRRIIPIR